LNPTPSSKGEITLTKPVGAVTSGSVPPTMLGEDLFACLIFG
jgi:hypothetical protein